MAFFEEIAFTYNIIERTGKLRLFSQDQCVSNKIFFSCSTQGLESDADTENKQLICSFEDGVIFRNKIRKGIILKL